MNETIESLTPIILRIITFLIISVALYTVIIMPNLEKNCDFYVPTEIDVFFNDGTKQNFKNDVYENISNIKLDRGDLSYVKCAKQRDGMIAIEVDLASFVKSYVVLKSTPKRISTAKEQKLEHNNE